ncbi:MAG: hypothetical protein ABUM51_11530 [Bacteroidota bacterium]
MDPFLYSRKVWLTSVFVGILLFYFIDHLWWMLAEVAGCYVVPIVGGIWLFKFSI